MIDKFGRKIDYLRISVTEDCNLKCIYCIDENNLLSTCYKDILTNDEIIKIATQCAYLGIKKIRISVFNVPFFSLMQIASTFPIYLSSDLV